MTREQLFHRHRGVAYAIAAVYFLPGADADDVRQEALVGLWKATGEWRPELGSFVSFARLAVRRDVLDAVKRANRLSQRVLTDSARAGVDDDGVVVSIVELLPGGRDPHDVFVGRLELEELVAGAAALSPLERRGLLCVVNGERQDWQLDNAAYRARVKLRRAA